MIFFIQMTFDGEMLLLTSKIGQSNLHIYIFLEVSFFYEI